MYQGVEQSSVLVSPSLASHAVPPPEAAVVTVYVLVFLPSLHSPNSLQEPTHLTLGLGLVVGLVVGQDCSLVSDEGHAVPSFADGVVIVYICVCVCPALQGSGVQALHEPAQLTGQSSSLVSGEGHAVPSFADGVVIVYI